MISDAYVLVTCDNECGSEQEIQLTPLAHHGSYDMRDVESAMKNYGWVKDGDRDICEDCAADDEEDN